jgi:hypothetical protein
MKEVCTAQRSGKQGPLQVGGGETLHLLDEQIQRRRGFQVKGHMGQGLRSQRHDSITQHTFVP